MGDSWAWVGYLYEEDDMGFDEQDEYLTGEQPDLTPYQEQKLTDRYGPISSQASKLCEEASRPGMYKNTVPKLLTNPFAEQNIAVGVADTTYDPAKPKVEVERLSPDYVRIEVYNIPNEQALRITQDILPKVLGLYLNKSRDYGGNVMSMLKLGPKASFVDLWRKVGKLKNALWDGQPMQGEQTDEILSDCVGHILITLDEMNQC